MPEQVTSIEKIEREAVAAAHRYTSVNEACPYSFYSPAGQVFKKAFQRERLAMTTKKPTTATTPRKDAHA